MHAYYFSRWADFQPTRLTIAIAALLAMWHFPFLAAAQVPVPSVLLLKDTERVISGNVQQRGEFYEVEIASNSKISIPKSKVAHIGGSLEELYLFKRQAISHWSVGDHYQLTQWCLANNLLVQATEHYSAAAERAPGHPRILQLATELERRMLRDPDFRAYLGMPPEVSDTELAKSSPANTTSTASDSVVTASTTSTASAQSAAPPQVARQFMERVQPILINRCSQSACHGAQSANHLRLIEPYPKAHARITSDNLASVMRHVSISSKEVSPLLRFATTPHGLQTTAAIAPTDNQLVTELQSWIDFAQNPVVAAVVTDQTRLQHQVRSADQRQFVPFQPAVMLVPVEPGQTQLRQVPQRHGVLESAGTLGVEPTGFPEGQPPPTLSELDALDFQLSAALGSVPTSAATTAKATTSPPAAASFDPFDPAEFNRKSQQIPRP